MRMALLGQISMSRFVESSTSGVELTIETVLAESFGYLEF